jgi:hypothetical protein
VEIEEKSGLRNPDGGVTEVFEHASIRVSIGGWVQSGVTCSSLCIDVIDVLEFAPEKALGVTI